MRARFQKEEKEEEEEEEEEEKNTVVEKGMGERRKGDSCSLPVTLSIKS